MGHYLVATCWLGQKLGGMSNILTFQSSLYVTKNCPSEFVATPYRTAFKLLLLRFSSFKESGCHTGYMKALHVQEVLSLWLDIAFPGCGQPYQSFTSKRPFCFPVSIHKLSSFVGKRPRSWLIQTSNLRVSHSFGAESKHFNTSCLVSTGTLVPNLGSFTLMTFHTVVDSFLKEADTC